MSSSLLLVLLVAALLPFARVRPAAKTPAKASAKAPAKSRPRSKAREQAQKDRAQKRMQLLKVFDDMLLRYDVLAQRVALTGMASQGTDQAAAKPRAPLPPRKARPRLRKP